MSSVCSAALFLEGKHHNTGPIYILTEEMEILRAKFKNYRPKYGIYRPNLKNTGRCQVFRCLIPKASGTDADPNQDLQPQLQSCQGKSLIHDTHLQTNKQRFLFGLQFVYRQQF